MHFAAKLGRDAIGIELNHDYIAMSIKRLKAELGMMAEIQFMTHKKLCGCRNMEPKADCKFFKEMVTNKDLCFWWIRSEDILPGYHRQPLFCAYPLLKNDTCPTNGQRFRCLVDANFYAG